MKSEMLSYLRGKYAWNSLFTGPRWKCVEKSSISKCNLAHRHVMLMPFAMDSSSKPVSYPSGKAKDETRVFVDSLFRQGDVVELPHEEQKHLRARRFRSGDKLVLFNSVGQTAASEYQNQKVLILEVSGSDQKDHNLSHLIAIPRKPSRADWLVEKLTELGADSITFMQTNRTVVADPSPNKLHRWRRIAVSASKQSMRDSTPEILVVDFEAAIQRVSQHPLPLLLSPNGKPLLSSCVLNNAEKERSVLFLVGPEGGFEDHETNALQDAGANRISLGGYRLRTETAAIASAAAICQFFYGGTFQDERRKRRSR